jgi:hypothetical protein
MLEALTCREAQALALDLNITSLVVASDYKQVVSDIAEGIRGKYGAIVAEIKARSTHFGQCRIIFEGRKSNFEAH